MQYRELRQKFADFFKSRGFQEVSSSSLLPTDSSVLLTTAGMQQFKPFYVGERSAAKEYGSQRLLSIQKCFRTSDIDDVGDDTHLTFFEMMGFFAFENDLTKEEAIKSMWEFLSTGLGFSKDRIYATYFVDDQGELPTDDDSLNILNSLKSDGLVKILPQGRGDNFWGPTGETGPCGPTVEFYVDDVEVCNIVFNEYYKEEGGTLRKLESFGVDMGAGLERNLAQLQGQQGTVYDTDAFASTFAILELPTNNESARIIADHARGAVFLCSEGVQPSNKEAGYILRRIIRQFAFQLQELGQMDKADGILAAVQEFYRSYYPDVSAPQVLQVIRHEIEKFEKTLVVAGKELSQAIENSDQVLEGAAAFNLFSTYGAPEDYIKRKAKEAGLAFDQEGFDKALREHQGLSRAGAEAKFGGHGLNDPNVNEADRKIMTRLHTATHLLHAALRELLGPSVEQAGSDITPERTRFDFTFDRKLTDEEKSRVEAWVNEQIEKELPVTCREMPKDEALSEGALAFFREKYPDMVKVYSIGEGSARVSMELCGGPHVENTGEIGRFRITKEESSSQGVRRIKAIVE